MDKMTLTDCLNNATSIAKRHGAFKIGRTSRELTVREKEHRDKDKIQWHLEEICHSPSLDLAKKFEADMIEYFLHRADADLRKKCLNKAEGEVGDEAEDSKVHIVYIQYVD